MPNKQSGDPLVSLASENTTYKRALRIAATVMQADGICRYDSGTDCKRVYPPMETDCIKCLEKWCLAKARRELKRGGA